MRACPNIPEHRAQRDARDVCVPPAERQSQVPRRRLPDIVGDVRRADHGGASRVRSVSLSEGWTEGTVQNYYARVSGFCGWAAREGYLSGTPPSGAVRKRHSPRIQAERAANSRHGRPNNATNSSHTSTSKHTRRLTMSRRRRTHGARTVLKRLTDEAGIDLDDTRVSCNSRGTSRGRRGPRLGVRPR